MRLSVMARVQDVKCIRDLLKVIILIDNIKAASVAYRAAPASC